MTVKKIKVIAYSGHKGEESPRAFFIDGEKIEIVEVLKMWIEERLENKGRKRFFKVKGSDGHTHTLFYDEEASDWFL